MADKLTLEEQAALKEFAGYIVTGRKLACFMVRTFALIGAVAAGVAGFLTAMGTIWTYWHGAR